MPYIGNQPSDLVVPTPTVDTFTGNGSQDNYTLVRAVNNAALLEVFVDNVQQQPTVAYSVSGTTLTFTEPPANGTSIYIIYRDNPSYPLLSVLDNTVSTASIIDNAVTSAKIASVANTQITGIMLPANGGTGQSSLTANSVVIGNGTAAVQLVAPGNDGNVLTSDGTNWFSKESSGGISSSLILFSEGII